MPKMKTSRSAAKRFKVTGTGKLKRNKAYKHKIKPKVIYMDGGFYGKDLFDYLEKRHIPFVCPMPLKRGRISEPWL